MRAGLIVFAVCLCIAAVLGFQQYRAFKTGLVPTQDVVLGLLYFIERHDGRFPATEQEFRAESFVQQLDGGAIRIAAPDQTRFGRHPHGYVIESLAPFDIRWGADLTRLYIDQNNNVRDAEGEKVTLVQWPQSPRSGKTYSVVLLTESARLRGVDPRQRPPEPDAAAP